MKYLTAVIISLALAGAAHAGRSCEEKPTDATTLAKSMELAQKTLQALDGSGAQVALVARVGQDLSKYNLRYSHVALAWRDHPQGRWLVVHELNECGTAQSSLFNEGLGNIFMEDVADGSVLVLKSAARGASSAATASVKLSQKAMQGLSLAAGTVVNVVALSTGHMLVLSGKAIAFIPNELGKALLHHSKV